MLLAAIVGPLSLHLRTPPRSRAPAPACKTASPTAALLFDCDGVIVETEELHRLAYNSAFEEFGLEVGGAPVVWDVPYYDRLQNTVGGGKPKMKWHFVNTCGGAWPTCTRRDGRTPADEAEGMALIDELQDAKTEAYKKIVDRAASPRPGVLELMDAAIAAPNLAVGICSAATRGGFERVVNSIVGAERLARLDVVIAGDDITNKKPDPEIYNVAAARLGLGKESCVVIEDSLVGLRAATGAGMRCLITYTPSTAAEDFYGEGAAAKVPDLGVGVTLETLFSFATSTEGEGGGAVVAPRDELASGVRDAK